MDIRKSFLDFFESKGHRVIASSALVPDDATLLFTNAGMVQFKDIFTGNAPIPQNPKATSSQTCIRAGGKHNDLDNVGYTARHHTFFEMLGNFSFGDYFKKEAIAYAWEFVTSEQYLNISKEKLFVTVHESDDEAFELWSKHIDSSRIYRFGDKDNFWQMGDTGACGPCSEIFYDQGEENFNTPEDKMGGDGDRFLEIWNLVFMQYERDENGVLHPLTKPSIDTGMGLERVTAVKEGVLNNYHSSLFKPIIAQISKLVGKEYRFEDEQSASYRVIADHLRAVSFLLAQGVNFDKEGRGYVLRRIMRRAIRHGYMLGLREPFMATLLDSLIEVMGESYDYLVIKAESIKSAMSQEEERFFSTIESGIKLFNDELAQTKEIFNGEVAFKLYDTFGFPLDLTQDMLREKNIQLDIEAFEAKMETQKAQSKASWKGSGDIQNSGDFKSLKETFGENHFVGYDSIVVDTKVLALMDSEFNQVKALDGEGWVLLETTPFYALSGGQCGDSGVLTLRDNSQVKVLDTRKFLGLNLSQIDGKISVGDEVNAKVDESRFEIAKHHSATHLLHSALREILGEHIAQAGSSVDATRLRFDFSHPLALEAKQLQEVESWVNDKIFRAIKCETKEMNIEEAKAKGAMALFSEKYDSSVRVVDFGDTSMELCGGIHVNNSSQIGLFMIIKESGVSAGVRRIEAICGKEAYKKVQSLREELSEISNEVKHLHPLIGINRLKEQIKTLKNEVELAQKNSTKELNSVMVGDVRIIVDEIEGGDIKTVIDEEKNRYEKVVIMLFQVKDDKVNIACGSKNTSLKAGSWVKEIATLLGGGGGGRADFAQAGGKDISKIQEAKEASLAYAKKSI
ncbi:MAG: alanine--tRNA ligase [Epsilonproteobacteria bacterium]|nr:alanine--tRNA ligase [Campylobacterota bacterium]MBD3839623.1 alanine--tRNA ligase [Campylobacterota bacterium]